MALFRNPPCEGSKTSFGFHLHCQGIGYSCGGVGGERLEFRRTDDSCCDLN